MATDTIMAATAPGGDSCSLDSQTGGITATATATVECDVTFPRSIENCTVLATPQHPQQDISGMASIRKVDNNTVRVTRVNGANNFQDEGLFAIEAICP